VNLTVRRDGRTFNFAVNPRREEPPIVETRTLQDGIDYLRVYSFGADAASFDQALDDAWDRLKSDRVIVDLRTNPGGAVRNVAQLASRLGYQGTMIVSFDRNNRRSMTPIPRSFVPGYKATQILYLVNGYSYSGAEILSAFGGTFGSTVIGTPTTGTSHSAIAFRIGEGVLQMGIRRNAIGPSAIDIEGKGVPLSETVTLDYSRLKKGEDSVIERAVELLSGSATR
jgi:carboxyl-terminal processing protease